MKKLVVLGMMFGMLFAVATAVQAVEEWEKCTTKKINFKALNQQSEPVKMTIDRVKNCNARSTEISAGGGMKPYMIVECQGNPNSFVVSWNVSTNKGEKIGHVEMLFFDTMSPQDKFLNCDNGSTVFNVRTDDKTKGLLEAYHCSYGGDCTYGNELVIKPGVK